MCLEKFSSPLLQTPLQLELGAQSDSKHIDLALVFLSEREAPHVVIVSYQGDICEGKLQSPLSLTYYHAAENVSLN